MSRPGWDNATECAGLRNRVCDLAPSDWAAALKIAISIPLPWYRVQSLAVVVTTAPDNRVDDLLDRACRTARTDKDAFRSLAVLAWVIDAALFRDRTKEAARVLRSALAGSDKITPPSSRARALGLLVERATRVGEQNARDAANALFNTVTTLIADPFPKWRNRGLLYLKRAVVTLDRDHRTLVEDLLTAHFGPDGAAAILSRLDKPWNDRLTTLLLPKPPSNATSAPPPLCPPVNLPAPALHSLARSLCHHLCSRNNDIHGAWAIGVLCHTALRSHPHILRFPIIPNKPIVANHFTLSRSLDVTARLAKFQLDSIAAQLVFIEQGRFADGAPKFQCTISVAIAHRGTLGTGLLDTYCYPTPPPRPA